MFSCQPLCVILFVHMFCATEQFQERAVSYQQFSENPSIIDDPNLVVKIGNKYVLLHFIHYVGCTFRKVKKIFELDNMLIFLFHLYANIGTQTFVFSLLSKCILFPIFYIQNHSLFDSELNVSFMFNKAQV